MIDKYKLMKVLSKKANLTILFSIKENPKKWSELEKQIYKKELYHGLQELFNLGLIQASITYDTPTGSKVYELTPLGQKIVQLLEQIEREFEEYHSAPPKDPEEFVGELIEDYKEG